MNVKTNLSMPPEVRDAYLRSHFALFVETCFPMLHGGKTLLPNWHIDVMANYLHDFQDRHIKHLIISVPPRHLKSYITTVCYVAWVLGHNPAKHIICLSYSGELAEKHARMCRHIMESPLYQHLFPNTRISKKRSAASDFETTKGGSRLATSVGGTLTGRGCDILIVDDPIKPEDVTSDAHRTKTNDFFDHTVWSRLNNKEQDGLILIMQRLHVDDPIAHLLATEPAFAHVAIPAIAEKDEHWRFRNGGIYLRKAGEVIDPRRESLKTLEGMRKKMGTLAFAAQYQQQPVPLEGNLVKWEWFPRYDAPPARKNTDEIIISWDTASKSGEFNDYSVGTVWLVQGDCYYLIDLIRKKLDYPALKTCVIKTARRHNANMTLVEDSGSGTALYQDICFDKSLSIKKIPVRGDKKTRLYTCCSTIEGGQVFLPNDALWLEAFKTELLAFPNVPHDDQVDSLSQFLHYMKKRERRKIKFYVGGQ